MKIKSSLERALTDNAVELTEEEISQVVGGDFQGRTTADAWLCWSEELGSYWLEAKILD